MGRSLSVHPSCSLTGKLTKIRHFRIQICNWIRIGRRKCEEGRSRDQGIYIYISKNVFEYQTATAAVNDDVEQPPSGDCVFWAGKLYIRPVDIRGSHPVSCQ